MNIAGRRSSFKVVVAFVIALMLALMGIPNHASAVEEPTNKVDVRSTGSKSTNEALPLEAGNKAGEKAITLFKNGSRLDDFDTLQATIDKMYELTKDGTQFEFTIQVNQDIDLTSYSQFGFPYGKTTLRSKDPAHPRTIKANNTNHNMMLGVVNGADLTIEHIIIEGNHQKRLLWVESEDALPASLTINDGTILQNGKVEASDQTKLGGAIYGQGASIITINGGIIRNNEATQAGGAICYIGTKSLTINGGEIYGNQVPSDSGFGGAIVLQGKAQINGGKIHQNSAYDGGGIAAGRDTDLEIKGGEIRENTASYAGGGLYLFKNSLVKLSGGQISNNQGKYGGGVTAAFNSNFVMEGKGVISGNQASSTGGGLFLWGTTPACDLKSGTIEENQARFGGGIRVRSSKAKIGGVIVQKNVAAYGGGIYSSIPDNETITLDGVQLKKNEALSGGGICLSQGGRLNLKNAAVEGNKAYYGGGLWTSLPMSIETTSFIGNEAMKSDEPFTQDGKPENNGHGGAIYVNTKLADNGVVEIKKCTFKGNKADKSGGAISIDETKGLVKISEGTVFDGNEATGALGHGGAIYSNLHAYMPEYDDGSTGPLVQPPTAKDYYYNIDTDATTVFKNNKAFRTFTPPSTKDDFVKLLYQSTSHPGTQYDHPLNNDDVNLIIFCQVLFDKNYPTDDPIHAAYLVMEKSTLGEDFPTDPDRKDYVFKEWNTQKDGKGETFKKDTVIKGDITLYAIYDRKMALLNEAPKLEVADKTIQKGTDLDLMSLIVKATDTEDGTLTDQVEMIDDGGFDKNKVGTYTITFKVTDSEGATTRAKATVTVKAKSVPPTPDKPNPDKPNPDKPNPDKPNPDKPNPDQPNPDQPNPDQPNPDKPNPDKPNPDKPNPNKPNPDKPNPDKPTPEKPNPEKPTPGKANPKTGDPSEITCSVILLGISGAWLASERVRKSKEEN